MKKVLAAVVAFVCGIGFLSADEFFGAIKKIEGDKITVTKFKKGDKTGEDATLTVAKDVKVVKTKFNKEDKKFEAGEALEGGLKNETLTKGGARARFITDGDVVKEIQVMGGGKKKKE